MNVLELILREQNDRHRKGLCLYCGISLGECWCRAQEPVEPWTWPEPVA